MLPEKIGFIGLGHIGGTVAKTIHRIHPDINIIAYDISEDTLKAALEDNVISAAYSFVTDDFSDCDYLYLCCPVLHNQDYLPRLKELVLMNPDIMITDVGSVKTIIHKQIINYGLEENFIGGHPMCGTEKSGYAHSTAYMMENAYYCITKTAKTHSDRLQAFKEFTDSLDALTIVMDYEEHDHTVGSISHLPHIISATLVNLVKNTDDERETMKTIAAGGFKDITRISSSSPLMWENICVANRSELLNLLDSYIAAMKQSREMISDSDPERLFEFFENAKDYRDSFSSNVSGPIKQAFHLYCDLIDEAGGIAAIATILAANNISIKNIGITHNREFQQGVLSIEFYDRDSLDHGALLLEKYYYTVYRQ